MTARKKNKNQLYKSRENRIVSGVLSGLADYVGMDHTLLRISFLISMAITGIVPGVFLYLIASVIMPQRKK